jgi:hypothetical protein
MPGLFDPPQQGGGLLGAGGNIGAGLNSFAHSDALLPAIANMFSGFATGQRADPQGMALQQAQATYDALLKGGAPEHIARAAALNPKEFGQYAAPYLDQSPKVQFITNAFGDQIPVAVRNGAHPSVENITPTGGGAPAGEGGGTGIGGIEPLLGKITELRNNGASEAEMIAALPKSYQGYMQSIVEGRGIPATLGFKSPLKTTMELLARTMGIDDAAIKARTELAKDMGNTKNGLGMKVESGGKVLNHLEGIANDASGLDTFSRPNNFLSAVTPDVLVKGANYFETNKPKNYDISRRMSGKVDSYAQEKAKFLAQGGGSGSMHERDTTREQYDTSRPKNALADQIEADLEMIEGQYRSMEQRRDTVIGPNNNSPKFTIRTPQQMQQIERIKANIAKMRGSDTQQAAPAQGVPQPGTVMKGYRFKGGNPADQNSWEKAQ